MQSQAVQTIEGPLLVLAGPGSGKTRVITRRIAWLLAAGVTPRQILAVTFTRKSAVEMKERLQGLVGEAGRRAHVSTFHALGLQIVREHVGQLGFSHDVRIAGEADQRQAIEQVLLGESRTKASSDRLDTAAVLARISLAKNQGVSPRELASNAREQFDLAVAKAYAADEDLLQNEQMIDFDDMVSLPLRLFRDSPTAADKYRDRSRFILVDEYQDTNVVQHTLLREHLTGPEQNLCIVGDDDQSIYGFRGADAGLILRFEEDYPGAAVVQLNLNYRSSGEIVALGNRDISRSPDRYPKQLRSDCGRTGVPVVVVERKTQDEEADFVAQQIVRLPKYDALLEMAILVRLT